jgi:hypothetical protein
MRPQGPRSLPQGRQVGKPAIARPKRAQNALTAGYPLPQSGVIFLWLGPGRIYERMSESGKARQKAVRQRRLSAALRENLKRRKAQARGRGAAASDTEQVAPHDSAGIDAEKPDRLVLPPRRQAGEG